jgi:hypothetical protein
MTMPDRNPPLRTQLVRLLDDATPSVTAQEAIDLATSRAAYGQGSSALLVDHVDSSSARRHSRLITRTRIGVALLAAAIVAVFVAPIPQLFHFRRSPGLAAPNSAIPARGFEGELQSVSVISPTSAWAVGSIGSGLGTRALILRWNGSTWDRVPIPNLHESSSLNSVDARSENSAWAVGGAGNGTLILHWNGSSWNRVPSPNMGSSTDLAAVSGNWIVGGYISHTRRDRSLILHWTGRSWKQVPSPNPDNDYTYLTGVSGNWAVGFYHLSNPQMTLILHWDGTSWTQVPSPNPGGKSSNSNLVDVSGDWAVGSYQISRDPNADCSTCPYRLFTLILHWSGTSWEQVPSPSLGGDSNLSVVGGSWAIGTYTKAYFAYQLLLHWNGASWQQVPNPTVRGRYSIRLFSVSGNWAVGQYAVGEFTKDGGYFTGSTPGNFGGSGPRTLILHWDGLSWKIWTGP